MTSKITESSPPALNTEFTCAIRAIEVRQPRWKTKV
jgi:hypothetical protein